jgi:hypothetical protein
VKKALLLFFCFVVFTGCITTPLDSENHDRIAKQFTPKSDRANVYIYRNKFWGPLMTYPVSVNAFRMGSLSQWAYYFLSVKPGTYIIKETYSWPVMYILNARAGKNYFVLIDTKPGLLSPNISIKEDSEADGKEAVRNRNLAARMESKK